MKKEIENYYLSIISNEIEEKYNCKVISITIANLLSICVSCKIKFNEDFLYKPFSEIGRPDTICFSEKTITFFRRVDLFDCVKELSNKN